MEQIRIHGRGGQGVVTAAELIALAAFYEGKESQAFPHFGVERTGAPIQSFARIDDKKIITREQIYQPTVLIIQDPTLLSVPEIFVGTNEDTKIIINSSTARKIKSETKHIYFSPATEIALEIFGKNIVNTVILGTFAKKTGLISLGSLKKAIQEKFKDKGQDIIKKNIKAVERAYEK